MWAWFASWWFLDGGRRRRQDHRQVEIPSSGSPWALVGMFWPFIVAFIIILILL